MSLAVVGGFGALACASGGTATSGKPPAAATGAAAGATSAAPATPAGPATSFEDGTYEVGKDILPGTYAATVPADSFGCYWERQKDLTGSFESIISNDNGKPGAHMKVTIATTDKGFKSQGCGTWSKQ